MQRILALLLFCLLAVPCGAFQITEFCPDPYLPNDEDEYLVIAGNGSLDGMTVSDGKGGFRFPPGTTISGPVTITRNSVAFEKTHGKRPDFEWLDHSPDVPDVIPGDTLRMANSRDTLMLYDRAKLVQQVSWPGDVRAREGQVHILSNGVWDRRTFMLGQSAFMPETFSNVTVTAFVSPDCSLEAFESAVQRAQSGIHVNVYEFASGNISASLIAAKQRGVSVDMLLEGGPVGGISPEEKSAIYAVNQSGILVLQMAPAEGGHAPYRYDHAKYLVIDDRAVFVTSENFKASGFPPKGITGNRGWGVIMENPGLAGYFDRVYHADTRGDAIRPEYGRDGPGETPPASTYTVEFAPATFHGATVTPVISPDTSDQITALLDSAASGIDIEQAYITNESTYSLNPYLATAINASRRGVHVRVLLDSYWYNVEDTRDNDEMVDLINRLAAQEHVPLEARCADLDAGGIQKIHNKGVIVDNRRVLVSSINWNSNSPNFNREAGVIIDHPGVAGYFGEVFEDDWQSTVRSPVQHTDYLKIAAVIVVIILLLILYCRKHVR